MEWPAVIEIVTKLGLTGTLAFAVYTLWQQTKALQAEIRALNQARIDDLKAMLKQID